MSSKKSGCGCLPIIGLITALALGGGYAYKKGWHQRLIGQNLTPLAGAKVIPDEAIMTSFISTNEQHWQQLEKLGIAPAERFIQEVTTEIDKELTALNIDYQEDIQPWLGNAMLAIVPENEQLEDSDILIVLGIKNPINAYKFFRKVQSDEEFDLESIKYKDIKIYTATDEEGDQTNLALLGNKVVLSDEIAIVKQSIDTYKGEPSLASDPENKQALTQPLNLKNSLVQTYITNYDFLLENALAESSVSKEKLDDLQPVKSVVFGIGAEDKQLKLQGFTKFNPDLAWGESQPLTNEIASKYPEQTLALINGQGISNFWNTLVKISEQDRDLKFLLNGIRTSTKWGTGLDLDEDIFGWMDGEFAIGIVPTKQVVIPELNLKLGIALILESSDRDTAQNTLNSLDNAMQQQLGMSLQTKQINKQTVTQWYFPYSDLDISYGWLDKKYLLFTFGNNVFDSMNNGSQSSLKTNPKFQKFVKKLPNNNLSYFYFDLEKVMTEIKQIPDLPIDYNSESIVLLDSIQRIGSTSTMTDANTNKTELTIWFK
ncbi:MAG: DUF3352 domain-containing protein [Xenococcaceae cyanobacterium MO_167.B27]|nr:DUF3352 domain-containing protein [Xenococcaceae cyanobacterium MO_167.B27]